MRVAEGGSVSFLSLPSSSGNSSVDLGGVKGVFYCCAAPVSGRKRRCWEKVFGRAGGVSLCRPSLASSERFLLASSLFLFFFFVWRFFFGWPS
jgi:hypothetical protein